MNMIQESDTVAPVRRRRRRLAAAGAAALLAGTATVALGWPGGAGASSSAWTTPTFAEGAGDIRDLSQINYNPVGYRNAEGDVVELRGVAGPGTLEGIPAVNLTEVFYDAPQSGAAVGPFGAKLFTLPCGMRPEFITLMGGSASADTFGKNFDASGIAVLPNGDVYAATYVTPYRTDDGAAFQLSFLLDNLSFHADGDPDDCGGVPPTTTTEPEVTTTTEAPEE